MNIEVLDDNSQSLKQEGGVTGICAANQHTVRNLTSYMLSKHVLLCVICDTLHLFSLCDC